MKTTFCDKLCSIVLKYTYIDGNGGEHLSPLPKQDETDIPAIPSPAWIKLMKSINARICIVQW